MRFVHPNGNKQNAAEPQIRCGAIVVEEVLTPHIPGDVLRQKSLFCYVQRVKALSDSSPVDHAHHFTAGIVPYLFRGIRNRQQ